MFIYSVVNMVGHSIWAPCGAEIWKVLWMNWDGCRLGECERDRPPLWSRILHAQRPSSNYLVTCRNCSPAGENSHTQSYLKPTTMYSIVGYRELAAVPGCGVQHR